MKARGALLLTLAWGALAGCRALTPIEVRLEMPGVTVLPPGSFDEVLVTDFQEAAPLPDLAAGRELRDYLAAEIARAFRGPVTRLGWREEALSLRKDRAIVLAGSVTLAARVLKAVDKTTVPFEGPFKTAGRGLVEKRRWTMTVEITVLSAADGALLFRRVFREERDYIDLDKPADFAFSELSERVRARLLPLLFGSPTRESRALLGR